MWTQPHSGTIDRLHQDRHANLRRPRRIEPAKPAAETPTIVIG